MYKMDEVYVAMAKMHKSAFEKSMQSDFYLGMQLACEKFLVMMNQTEGYAHHPYVQEITDRIMQIQPAFPGDDTTLHIYIDGKWKDRKGIDR